MRYLLGSMYATPSLAELSEWTGSLSKQRPFDLLRVRRPCQIYVRKPIFLRRQEAPCWVINDPILQ